MNTQLRPAVALLLIVALYVNAFGQGIYLAVVAASGNGPGTVDYSTSGGRTAIIGDLGGIAVALAALYLICRWLQIPATLAGVARRTPALPALFTAVVAYFGFQGAQIVLALLKDSTVNTNQVVASNSWSVLSLINYLNAGVVEEIIIVAVPLLLLRRLGWHPAIVIAVSIAMRWPYHIYHAAVATLPWVLVWGGVNAALYLWLRRLWPLVLVHMLWDVHASQALGQATDLVVTIVTIAGLLWLLVRLLLDQRRLLDRPVWQHERAVRRFLWSAEWRLQRRWLAIIAGLTAVGGVLLALGSIQNDLDLKIFGTIALVVGIVLAVPITVTLELADLDVIRDPDDGRIRTVVRWHRSYTGDAYVQRITGDPADAVAAVARIARATTTEQDQDAVITVRAVKPGSEMAARFAEIGYPPLGKNEIIHIPLNTAASLDERPARDAGTTADQ